MSILKRKLSSLALSVLVILFSAGPVYSQALSTQNTTTSIRVTFASEQITVAGTAIGFTAGTINPTVTDKPAGLSQATLATCVNNGAQIRILSSGTNPTTTLGLLVESGTSFVVAGYTDISAFRAIRTTSTSSTLDCQYSRVP